jgi:hypothetical protein
MVYSDRVYLDTQGSLILENAQESDSAKYVCQVENTWGKEVESAFVDVRMGTKVVAKAEHQGRDSPMFKNYSLLGFLTRFLTG